MTAAAATNIEYEVWFDAHDGMRLHQKALTRDDIEQIISNLNEDRNRIKLLAQSVGLKAEEHELNIEIFKVTTSSEQVNL